MLRSTLFRKNFSCKISFCLSKRSLSQIHKHDLTQFQRLAINYPSVGFLSTGNHWIGSCVLIEDKIALTATHCFPSNWCNTQKKVDAFFGSPIGVEVIKVVHHPLYNRHYSPLSMSYDISILLLKSEILHIPKAKINFNKIAGANNCIAVGFPGRFAPNVTEVPQQLVDVKIGVKLACYSKPFGDSLRMADMEILESKIGYNIDLNNQKYIKNDDQLHSASIYPGMSGGGLFKNNKLIGLNRGSFLDPQTGRILNNFFVPLSKHQSWLEENFDFKIQSNNSS